jgi:hypothetical protein
MKQAKEMMSKVATKKVKEHEAKMHGKKAAPVKLKNGGMVKKYKDGGMVKSAKKC